MNYIIGLRLRELLYELGVESDPKAVVEYVESLIKLARLSEIELLLNHISENAESFVGVGGVRKIVRYCSNRSTEIGLARISTTADGE